MALPTRRDDNDLGRWEPLSELDRLNRHLQDYLGRWTGLGGLGSLGDVFTPLADVEENDDAYVVEIELPGTKRDDISLEVAGRRLTVTGERKERERVGVLRRRTRTVGQFRYEVVLPGEVDEGGVQAALDEGVLTVTVPKAASEKSRRIQIT